MTAARQARQAADQHLERIRASYGLNHGSPAAQNLVRTAESACQILAEQLYQKSTHFLLELVQNADDVTYHDTEPTLHLTYTNGFLRVDCNEVGFSPQDVDALCGLGQSSKAGAGVATQFVGEKGIGFKSVFKVADQVWISSKHYEFKFDKNAKLGMVAPILESFPVAKRDGWTSFYLKLTPESETAVVKELQSSKDMKLKEQQDSNDMKPELLLFLRQLRKVVLTTLGSLGRDLITTTWRRDDVAEFAGQEVKELSVNGSKLASYLFMRHWAEGLPEDERRTGVKISEIIIAFPLNDNNEPRLESQVVCAYLPIRDYGFHFLIQADFLLIASREDVDNSAAWNIALRNECVKALHNCVNWFNGSSLKFVWPRYLPAKLGPIDFFLPLKKQMLSGLSLKEVLEDLTGELRPPRSLIYVPMAYRDDSGEPLTAATATSGSYLSTKYDDLDYKYLQRLGVKEMDHGLFLDHLEKVTANLGDFKQRPAGWHSRLAGVLAEVWEDCSYYGNHFKPSKKQDSGTAGKGDPDDASSDSDFEVIERKPSRVSSFSSSKARVLSLPIIPLRGGRWVAGSSPNLLFAASTSSWDLPGGMGFSVIESAACQDSRRANLYRLLGAKNFDPKKISQLIVSLHGSTSFKPNAVSRSDLISQAKFLYTSGWQNNDGAAFIWLATELNTRAKGQKLYIDTKELPLSATHFFAQRRAVFAFVHQDYLSVFADDEATTRQWHSWLQIHACLSTVPRLARTIRRVSSTYHVFVFSPEFEFIIDMYGAYSAITLICEYWNRYQLWIAWPRSEQFPPITDEPEKKARVDPAVEASYRQLQKRIRSIKVECTDGTEVPLEKTVLPVSDIPKEVDGCVSFLKLREPDHPRWKNLSHFGVGVTQDLDFYYRCLKNFSQSRGSLRKAAFIYEQIQARSFGHKDLVDKFKGDTAAEKLIYVPLSRDAQVDPDEGSWVRLSQCLWDGPQCMRVHFCLSKIYPSCQRLFTELLKLDNASMFNFMEEAKHFEPEDDIGYMKSIFLKIEKCMENKATHTRNLSTMGRDKIFPVTDTAAVDNFGKEFDRLLTPGSELFIADTVHMLSSFAGLLPLLAFGVDDASRMKRLLHGLGVDPKRLSRAAESLPKTSGKVEFHRLWTEWFQVRYEFIARLVEPSMIDPNRRKGILAMLRNIEVFSSQYIVQRYRVKLGTNWIEGRERPGNVVLTPSTNSLKIYLKEGYLEKFRNPIELVHQLAELTGINERQEGKWLLQVTLTEPDLNRISEIFDYMGVPSNFDDDEVDNSWLKNQRFRMGTQTVPIFNTNTMPISTAESLLNMFGDTGYESDEDWDSTPGNGHGGGTAGSSESPWAGRSEVRMVTGSGAGGNRQRIPPQEPDFDEELESRGQLFFSRELAGILGDNYNAEVHWTSILRSNHDLPEYEGDAVCSFTVNDSECNGKWTKAVAEAGYQVAKLWRSRPPTWHIEVRTLPSKSEQFGLSDLHFELARRSNPDHQKRKAQRRTPTEVMMLVVVWEMDSEKPKWEMLPDPWDLYLHGLLRMKPTGDFVCNLPTAGLEQA